MAKAKKEKKQDEEKISPAIEETNNPEIGETPPSVTLDEVKEVSTPEPELPKEAIPEVLEKVKEEPVVSKTVQIPENATMGNKIMAFLENKPKSEIRINDYLKSLFKPPKFGEPPLWQNQAASKEVKSALDKLHKDGDIEVLGNAHLKLGTAYYPDTQTMRTEYYSIDTIPIFIKKVN